MVVGSVLAADATLAVARLEAEAEGVVPMSVNDVVSFMELGVGWRLNYCESLASVALNDRVLRRTRWRQRHPRVTGGKVSWERPKVCKCEFCKGLSQKEIQQGQNDYDRPDLQDAVLACWAVVRGRTTDAEVQAAREHHRRRALEQRRKLRESREQEQARFAAFRLVELERERQEEEALAEERGVERKWAEYMARERAARVELKVTAAAAAPASGRVVTVDPWDPLPLQPGERRPNPSRSSADAPWYEGWPNVEAEVKREQNTRKRR